MVGRIVVWEALLERDGDCGGGVGVWLDDSSKTVVGKGASVAIVRQRRGARHC